MMHFLSQEYLDYYTCGVSNPSEKFMLVGMSGGVDSSVVAGIMRRVGFRIAGVTLQLSGNESIKSCCSTKDICDAQQVALDEDFPHYTLYYGDEFKKHVVDNFVDEYSKGYTPSPCVRCNQKIKFGELVKFAKQIGADMIATGHYIKHELENGQIKFYRAKDEVKDQTYFMSMVSKEHMNMIRFPLGPFTKKEVRQIAEDMNLVVAKKPESQDLCFIQNGNYRLLLQEMIAKSNGGVICDIEGKVLGFHKGIENYTVGQKKGIDVRDGPWYVLKIIGEENKVIIGRKGDLYRTSFKMDEINWMVDEVPSELMVKVRARQNLVGCRVDDNVVMLNEPTYAIAPGQICAFYKNNQLIGGGRIVEDII